MSIYTNKQTFKINSSDRLSGTNTSFTYNIQMFEPKNITDVVLIKASIPISFYNVQSIFNSFELYSLDLPGPTNRVTVSVAASNYTRTNFGKVLRSELNTIAATYSLGYTFTVTQDGPDIGDRGKYIYTLSTTPANLPAFIFTGGLNLHEMMGFDVDSTNTFTTDISGTSLMSSNVTSVASEPTLFIRSNICQNDNDNILSSIYTTNAPTFSYASYICPEPFAYSKQFSKSDSNAYYFQLTDENNNVIETNGLPIIFDIMVFTVDNEISTLMKNFMKMYILEKEEKKLKRTPKQIGAGDAENYH